MDTADAHGNAIPSSPPKLGGADIGNVGGRLKLYYGPEYGVRITSAPGKER